MARRKRKRRSTLLPSKPRGPKTPQGKRRSSLNALKHGRYSLTLLDLYVDSPALYEAVMRNLRAAKPSTETPPGPCAAFTPSSPESAPNSATQGGTLPGNFFHSAENSELNPK